MGDAIHDVVIVGGGIVGSATALALTRRGLHGVAVLEAEDRLAAHQSGHNSGVIHSGLYYQPGSQKAALCVAGRRAMYGFCANHGIAHERCGKLVVATRSEELPRLADLEARGLANGLAGLRRLAPQDIAAFEPHAVGLAALWVPETGIVDYAEVTATMGRLVCEQGGEMLTGARVGGVRRLPGELVLETTRGSVHARFLVNCAGLQADRIARLCGVDSGLRIIPFRGEYHALVPERAHLVRNLIYPVPDPRFPFLGVHFTRGIHGGVEAGPNAVLALRREGYDRLAFDPGDAWEIVSNPAVWKMSRRYWQTGLGEISRSLSIRALVHSLRALVPELAPGDLRRAGAGVRAQALDASGALVDDFRIQHAERMIHVLNAPSPAATASLAIGEVIATMVVDALG
jgi:L-2-hydroxyglutarate oxidase